MNKAILISAAACAFVLSSFLPAAALPTPKANESVAADSLVLAKHHGDRHRKKRRHRPSIQFYYNPWPYYGYRYDPFFYHGYPYGPDYYYDDYYYGHDWVYRAPVRSSRSKHVKWCKNHYRTYNVRTDKFTGKNGKKYRCNSPYDGR